MIASRCRVAATMWSRMQGLLGSGGLAEGEGLWIRPCNSVHTLFMGFPIDVVFLDRDLRCIAIRHEMRPWRLSQIHFRAHSVLELPAGTCARAGLKPGESLAVSGFQ